MRKFVLAIFIIAFLMVGLYFVFWGTVIKTGVDQYNKYEGSKEELKELVGEEILMKGDTLMVVDYSVVNGTVTLDNGKEVSSELVQKLKIEKDQFNY